MKARLVAIAQVVIGAAVGIAGCSPAAPEETTGRWDFAGGASLSKLAVPDVVDLDGQQGMRVRGLVRQAAGCRLDLRMAPGDGASEERVRPREVPRRMPDARVGHASVLIDSDEQAVDLVISPGPGFHSRQAVLEAMLACGAGGGQQQVVAGAARAQDPLPAGGRPSVAQLAVVDVIPRSTFVEVGYGQVEVDGRPDDAVWRRADWHELQPSMAGGRVYDPALVTVAAMAWDEHNLYVAGRLRDRDIWTKFERRDDPLYRQEAFEVFVAGDNSGSRYLELQVSARNVIFDAYFPTYRKGDEGRDFELVTAVELQGTVNNRKDEDRGWTVEMAVPWATICEQTAVVCPPGPGTELRANVFRLEKADRKSQSGYALSPTRKPDFHAWNNAAVLELAPRP